MATQQGWADSNTGPRPAKGSRPARRRRAARSRTARVEALESRLLLATRFWTGGSSTSSNWSESKNWSKVGNQFASLAANDDLVFPAGVPSNRLNPTNDTAIATFGSITVQGAGYTIGGNAVSLANVNPTSDLSVDRFGLNASGYTGSSTIALSVGLGDVASGNATVATGSTLTIGSATTAGVLSGPVALTKAGGGTLSLQGTSANTYSGGTTIGAGTLELAKTAGLAAIPAGALSIGDGLGTDIVRLAAAEQIANTASVSLQPGAQLALNGQTETVGTLTGSSGSTITFVGTGGTAGSLSVNVATGSATFAGSLVNTGASAATPGTFTKLGSGELVLSSSSPNYSGAVALNLGTLTVGADGALGTGTLTINGGTLQASGTRTLANPVTLAGSATLAGGPLTLTGDVAVPGQKTSTTLTLTVNNTSELAGTVADRFNGANNVPRALAKLGTGTLVLSGTNTFTGALSVARGVVSVQSDGALGTATAGTTVSAGATLQFDGGVTVAEPLTLNGGGAAGTSGALQSTAGNNTLSGPVSVTTTTTVGVDAGQLTLAGAVSGGAGLTKAGDGTLVLAAANTYTGATAVTDGVLDLQGAGTPGDLAAGTTVSGTGALRVSTAAPLAEAITLNGSGFDPAGGSLVGAAGVTVSGPVTLAADARVVSASGVFALAGAIGGPGGVTFSAAAPGATVVLSGANTYGRGTSVAGPAVLRLGASGTIPDGSAVSLADGASLDLNGFSETVGSLSGAAGSAVATGGGRLTAGGDNTSTTFAGAIGGSGGLTKAGAGVLTLAGANTATGATIVSGGTLALGAAERIADASSVSVASGATFNLGGFAETVGSLGGAGAVTLGAGTLTVGADNTDAVFSGGIAGAGGLVKVGTGTQTLAGASSFAGTTAVNAGVLDIQNSTALGSTAGGTTVAAGATLQLRNNASVGQEPLTLNGAGAGAALGALLNLSGANTWSGPIALGSDATVRSESGSLTLSATATVATNGHTLTYDGRSSSEANNWNGAISGTGGLVKTGTGPGSLSLRAVNTYTGPTVIQQGAVRLFGPATLGNAAGGTVIQPGASLLISTATPVAEPLTIAGLGFQNSGVLRGEDGATLTGPITLAGDARLSVLFGGTFTVAGAVSGGYGLEVDAQAADPATLILSGANTYTGATGVIRSGVTLKLGAAGVIPDGSAVSLAAGSSLDLNGFAETVGSLAGAGAVNLGAGTLTAGGNHSSTAFSGVIGGATGSFTKAGTGVLTLSGANTYGGTTAVVGGTLRLGAAGVIPDSGLVAISSVASFDLNGFNETVGGLDGFGTIVLGAGTLTAGGNNATTFYQGVISGTGGLVKTGSGTLILTGDNTLTGTTTVAAGALRVTGVQPGSPVVVQSGAILTGTGSVGALTVRSGGRLTPGPGTAVLTAAGLTLDAGSSFVAEVQGTAPGAGHDQVRVTGPISLAGALAPSFNLTTAVGATATLIANVAGGPVQGTFAGRPEGSVLLDPGGVKYAITYAGGAGNDVVLTHVNSAPTLTAGNLSLTPASIAEGQGVALSGSFGDVDALDGHTVVIDWGDGQSTTLTLAAGVLGFGPASHTYADDPAGPGNTYPVTVTVSDSNGGTASAATSATVTNVAPTVTLGTPAGPVDEGSAWTLTGSFTDPGADAPWTATVDYGDGSGVQPLALNADRTFALAHAYADDGSYTVTVRVTDKDGEVGTATATAVVTNVAPTVTLGAIAAVDEGSAAAGAGSFTDPGADTPWTATVDYGDGTGPQPLALKVGKTFGLSHLYGDNGAYTITVSVTDKDGAVGTAYLTVAVNNVAPTATFAPAGQIAEGSTATVLFTDAFDPSGADSVAGFTYLYDFDGDGAFELTTTSPSATHGYADNGAYAVRGRIQDKDGGYTDYTTTIVVTNVAPTVTLGAIAPADEGSVAAGAGSFTDPGADTWTATIDYGDGSGVQTLALNVDKTFALGHAYADDGSYTVTVRVTDKEGEVGTATAIVTVNNVAPVVGLGTIGPVTEGSALSTTGSFTDPGADAPWTATVDYGDGSGVQPLAVNPDKTFALGHAYADNGVFTVTVTVTDKDGGTGTATAEVTVDNVAPVVTLGTFVPVDEGSVATAAGSFADPGADAPWTATVDYGDGSGVQPLAFNPDGTFALGHEYADDGLYTITVTVTDKDGAVGTATAFVTVRNVAPDVTVGTVAPITEGTATAPIAGSFSDPGADTWTATVDYGDGTGPQPLPLNPDGTFTVGGHLYRDSGTYTVTVAVTDDDGGTGTASSLVSVANVAPTVTALYRPGDLIGTFGNGGVVVTDMPGSTSESAIAAVLQPDGKTVVLLSRDSYNGPRFSIARYDTTGGLDPTFGVGGVALVTVPHLRGLSPSALALQPDGKLVVVGMGYSEFLPENQGDFLAVRLTASGALDTTFGPGGLTLVNLAGPSDDRATGVAIQADGKIVLGGPTHRSDLAARTDFAAIRLNADGTLDTSFGIGSRAFIDFNSRVDAPSAIAIGPGGKIVLAGYSAPNFSSAGQFAVARLNADGSPDSTFNGTGRVLVTGPGQQNYGRALVVQPDGKVVVGGFTQSGSGRGHFGLVRLTDAGALDATFGTGGAVTTNLDNEDQLYGLGLQADGSIIAVGNSYGSSSRARVVRYTPSGALDTGFGSGGSVVLNYRNAANANAQSDDVKGVIVGPDGVLTVYGGSYLYGSQTVEGDSWDVGLARLTPAGGFDATFGTDGRVVSDLQGPSDNWAMQGASAVQADGKSVVLVTSRNTNGNLSHYSLLRYRTDGALDPTFGAGGILSLDGALGAGRLDGYIGLEVQPDGRLLVVGTTYEVSTGVSQLAVLRFNIDGTPDSSFGTGGALLRGFPGSFGGGYRVAAQADGSIVIAGISYTPETYYDLVVWRVLADGSPDPSFHGGEPVTVGVAPSRNVYSPTVGDMVFLPASLELVSSLTLGPDGSIYVGGNTTIYDDVDWDYSPISTTSGDALLVKLRPDGSLDTAFGDAGIVIADQSHQYDDVRGLSILPDGSVVAIGNFVARYRPDGTPDAAFGGGTGRVTPEPFAGFQSGAAAPDGTVLVVGSAYSPSTGNRLAVFQYRPDGTPDTDFAPGGRRDVPTGAGTTSAYGVDLVLAPDRSVLITGVRQTDLTRNDVVLARFFGAATAATDPIDESGRITGSGRFTDPGADTWTATVDYGDGTGAQPLALKPDKTFDLSHVYSDNGSYTVTVTATDGDGGVGIDTFTATVRNVPPKVNAYQGAGDLVGSFGQGGTVVSRFEGRNSAVAVGSVVLADGRIVTAATRHQGYDDSAVVLTRRLADGSVDTTFGQGGTAVLVVPDHTNAEAAAVALQPDGKLVVVGFARASSNNPSDIIAARFNTDGTLDPTFGAGGLAVLDLGQGESAYALALQGDGKIVLVGQQQNYSNGQQNGPSTLLVARLTAAGLPDATFGSNGFGNYMLSNGWVPNVARAVVVQADGRILVAATAEERGYDLIMARLTDNGSLDPSYGTYGRTQVDLGLTYERPYELALQADGKAVVAGSFGPGSGGSFGLMRFNTDGSVDSGFGSNGLVTAPTGTPYAQGRAVRVAADGTIVAAGYAYDPASGNYFDVAVARYLEDGSLDESFGAGGLAVFPTAASEDPCDVNVLADGSVIVTSRRNDPATGSYDILLTRLTPAGLPDAAFGSDGSALAPVTGPALGQVGGFVALPDGKFLSVGDYYESATGGAFQVLRYNPDGSLDATFGAGGRVVTDFSPGSYEYAAGVALLPGGDFVVVGQINVNGVGMRIALARYHADGSLDATFGDGGKLIGSLRGTDDTAVAVSGLADGTFLVAAVSASPVDGHTEFAVAKYLGDGSLDPAFGTGGVATARVGSESYQYVQGMVVQPDGKIVVAGLSYSPGFDKNSAAVARFNPDGTLDSSFGTGGLATAPLAGRWNWAGYVGLQPDGSVLVAGTLVDPVESLVDYAVVRFTPAGLPDAAFGTGGVVTTDFGGTDQPWALTVLPDGRFVVGGIASSQWPDGGDFGLAFYLADGTPDLRYGSGGRVTTDLGAMDTVWALHTLSDGSLLAGGYTQDGNNYFVAWARYDLTAPESVEGSAFVGVGSFADPGADTWTATVDYGDGSGVQPLALNPDKSFSLSHAYADDGLYTITVTVTDKDGGVGTDAQVVLVTNAPPSVTPGADLSGDEGAPVQGVLATFSDPGALDTHTATIDWGDGHTSAGVVDELAHTVSGSHAYADDGTYTITVTVTDDAGDSSGAALTASIANVAPTVLAPVTAGELDPSFGQGGVVVPDLTERGWTEAYGAVAQPDGKVVSVGTVSGPIGSSFIVLRSNPDGTLDASFGDGGRVAVDVASHSAQGYAVAVQADGKLLVGGSVRSQEGDWDFALWRFDTDGSPDTTFGDGGLAVLDFNRGDQFIHGLAVQPDGKIVAVGPASSLATPDLFATARFNSDGSPDEGFGSVGWVAIDLGTVELAEAVALQGDGKIVVAGRSRNDDGYGQLTVVRLQADGTLDATFGTFGTVRTPFSRGGSASAVAVQPDGQIVVAGGVGDDDGNADAVLLRYNTDGSPDAGFGGGTGRVVLDLGPSNSLFNSLALMDDGRIVAAGYADTGTFDRGFAVARFGGDGTPDSAFGTAGLVVTDLDPNTLGIAMATGVIVLPGGSVVASGWFEHDGEPADVALVGYYADGTLDPDYASGGMAVVTVNAPTASDVGGTIAVQADGGVIVVGTTNISGRRSDLLVARYDADGTPDPAFGAAGRTVTFAKGGQGRGTAVAVAADGTVVVLGVVLNAKGGGSTFLGLFHPDGSSETTTIHLSSGPDEALGLVIDASGRFVVGGSVLARFLPTLELDTTFGTEGTGIVSSPFSIASLALQADGRIVAAGTSGGDFAVARYDADGHLDTSFDGGTGVVTADFFGLDDAARSIAVQADGKIVVAGGASRATDTDFALLRLNPDGTLDATFGAGGQVATDVGEASGDDAAFGLVVQPDGKIVVVGDAAGSGGSDLAVVRYLADGTLDRGFGLGGRVTTGAAGRSEHGRAIGLAPDGAVVVAGRVDETADILLARYLGADAAGTPTLDAGQSYHAHGAFTDPGADTWTATVDYGDGAGAQPLALNPDGTFSLSHTFDTPGDFEVTVAVTDEDGGTGSISFTVHVNDVPPTLALAGPSDTAEGEEYALQLLSGGSAAAGITGWTINWGDGHVETVAGNPGQATHVYADGFATYVITATVSDAYGTSSVPGAVVVSVANVDPTLDPMGDMAADAGQPVDLTFSLSDLGFGDLVAGTDETFTCWIDWGDDSNDFVDVVVAQGSPGVPTQGTVSASHTFADPGDYFVVVTVSDDDGGQAVQTFYVHVVAAGADLGANALVVVPSPGDSTGDANAALIDQAIESLAAGLDAADGSE